MADIPPVDMQELFSKVTDIHDYIGARSMSDHDLLIRLNTMSETVVKDVGELKTSVLSQVSALDTRVRALEAARWMILGASGVVGAIASILVELWVKKP